MKHFKRRVNQINDKEIDKKPRSIDFKFDSFSLKTKSS